MPRTISIEFKGDIDPVLLHRIRNFGEDLYREFTKNGQAAISIEEVDRAIDKLQVTVAASRHLGTVLSFIKKELERHGLRSSAEVKR